jgi:hypothetical protein
MSDTHSTDQCIGVPKHYHIIPVDAPKEQVILPIAREHLKTDEIAIFPLEEDVDEDLDELTKILRGMLGHETTVEDCLATVKDAYSTAYVKLKDYLERDENCRVWVNVAGAADGCGVAFSQAATALQIEYPEHRPNINIYTVSNDGKPEPVGSAPSGQPTDVGKTILRYLYSGESPTSITELARCLSNKELEPAFRSKVQYNVKKLEKQGYLKREGDHQMRPLLTPTGRMWVDVHAHDPDNNGGSHERD